MIGSGLPSWSSRIAQSSATENTEDTENAQTGHAGVGGAACIEICADCRSDSHCHQSRQCNRASSSHHRADFADVPHGPRALHGIDFVQRRRDKGDDAKGRGHTTRCMKIIIAPDKFKDCLSAPKVAEAIAAGLKLADPYVQIDICPMADGGEGIVEALVKATGGRFVTQGVTGPIPGTIVGATFGFLGDGTTAVIEMSAASGLHLLRQDERNPLKTTTYGTGELIKRALE